MMIKVLVTEDHPMMRNAIHTTLESDPEIEVSGTADSGEELFELLVNIQPDLVLLDLALPDCYGLEILKRLKNLYPDLAVLIFSSSVKPDEVADAVQNGALGYLSKFSESDELLAAVHTVGEGKPYLPSEISEALVKGLHQQRKEEKVEALRILTQREIEILAFLSEGLSNRQIAEQLNISEKTVRTHIHNMMKKLELNTRGSLILFGIQQELNRGY